MVSPTPDGAAVTLKRDDYSTPLLLPESYFSPSLSAAALNAAPAAEHLELVTTLLLVGHTNSVV
jgi:hypothetical protein